MHFCKISCQNIKMLKFVYPSKKLYMKRIFVLFLLSMGIMSASAYELVGAWKIVGQQKGDENPRQVSQDALNLLWIEVEGNDIKLRSSYRDLNDIKLYNPVCKGKHDEREIYTFDITGEEGELFIVMQKSRDDISVLSFLENWRDFSIYAVASGEDLDKLNHNMRALELTITMKKEKGWEGTLEENYIEVLEILNDNGISFNKGTSSASKPATTEQPLKPSESQHGVVKISGYTDIWSSYSGRHTKNSMGSLTLETRPSHYIGILHNNNATNLSASDKERTKWSTRNGAINVKLPSGATLNSTDEVICWEKTYPQSKERQQLLFIWDKSSHHFQCVRNFWDGNKLSDTYYFSCYDVSAWSKIRDRLMQELPYCAQRIY